MERKEIIEAYIFLRNHNHSIPSQTLDFIKDASLSVFDSLDDNYCRKCQHNGNQTNYPSGCTGCGSYGEKRHFVLRPTKPDTKTVDRKIRVTEKVAGDFNMSFEEKTNATIIGILYHPELREILSEDGKANITEMVLTLAESLDGVYKKRWEYIKSDPGGARALLLLLKERKGSLDDFDTMVDRIIESRSK